jgi:uncharacterized membrane protein YfcA
VDPVIVLFGFGVGALIGLTGIGGGSLMTPLLVLVLGVNPVVAIGTDLAYGAVTKTVGAWRHLRRCTVDVRLSAWMAVGSVPGVLAGAGLVDRLHHAYGTSFDEVVLRVLGIVLVLVALTLIVRTAIVRGALREEHDSAPATRSSRLHAVLVGAPLGFILGFTSVGSGVLIGFALILMFRLRPRRVVGTDVFHAAILLWAGGLAHFAGGNVDLGLMANILAGSLPGVWLGSGLITRVSADALRPALAAVLLASSLAVLRKGGLDVPLALIAGVPIAAGAVAWRLARAAPTPVVPA